MVDVFAEGPAGPDWQPGQRVSGDQAVLVAQRHHRALLGYGLLGDFPVVHPPLPPVIPEDMSRDDQLRYLIAVYEGYVAHKLGKKARPWSRIKLPTALGVLPKALEFFTGAARPGISETYEDGRRKVPEKLSPYAWVVWRMRPRPAADVEPPIPARHGVYNPVTFKSSRLVNMFVHQWKPLFTFPPFTLHQKEARAQYDRVLAQVRIFGFSTTEELDRVVQFERMKLRHMLDVSRRQRDDLFADHEKVVRYGGWSFLWR